ncbi:glutamine--tRNA ligase/YqeY domain fusion protein [uncultured Gimesia sp.]|mgnify:CR=1 FL=1|uniref:glutamine--tRNA ligase/YqeY domain fusion protein n=1 Tax=uncultured Gimesia sp. TaxID=1678688 RepID=UPI0030DC4D9B|tara:strand:- start:231582 stop:233303 length:1722 start_codon:yes stop_codon:yes gene_type:complete
MSASEEKTSTDFIRAMIQEDNRTGKHDGRVQTRFPPEPNGYLHIGHAKSICLNFGVANENPGGLCNLRFDDTNPEKEDVEYVDSIKEDVRWLGFDWDDREYFASDYFDQLYEFAVTLIKKEKAYACDLPADKMREYRGTATEPGKPSPGRSRSVEENLDLFERMKNGEFKEGEFVLRAKIDLASPNFHMRDPVIYRVRHVHHHRTGDKWCIYPMYDYTHCISDSIEKITHSICTLEFEDHRPLYDWILDELEVFHPQQIEFARLNMTYTVMSKRKLLELVQGDFVSGWDDPRMPTICGMRRRGVTSEALRAFCKTIGVTKFNSMTDKVVLENCIRDHLNQEAPRVMGVLNPLRVVIENYPEDSSEELDAINNPNDESAGTRKVPFSKVIYIEKEDFMEEPPKKFFRLSPGKEVRLRYAYFVTCVDVIKDDSGEVVELRCTYDPETKGGNAPDGRKVKATIHWVSEPHAVDAEVRLYDHLFNTPNPEDLPDGVDYKTNLNSESLQVLSGCKLEPSLKDAEPGSRFQFERLGYFCVDSRDSTSEKPVFNRTVTLRDAWAKLEKQAQNQPKSKKKK